MAPAIKLRHSVLIRNSMLVNFTGDDMQNVFVRSIVDDFHCFHSL